jgi:4-hydroxybenzoate polyprenyltransferase
MYYDSIYAYQDRLDDITAGVKSTALAWQEHGKSYLSFFATATWTLWTTAGYMTGAGAPFYVGMLGVGSHLAYQIASVDLDNTEDCAEKFKQARYTGLLYFISILAGKF